VTSAAPASHTGRRLRRLLGATALAAGALACEELPNVPPDASFLYTPVAPIYAAQTRVAFNASPSRDSDGTIRIYRWNWGDGSDEQSLNEALTSHVFPANPVRCIDVTYAVLLTVVDDKGGSGSTSQTIKVSSLPTPDCTRP
jgi:hypothetical protein